MHILESTAIYREKRNNSSSPHPTKVEHFPSECEQFGLRHSKFYSCHHPVLLWCDKLPKSWPSRWQSPFFEVKVAQFDLTVFLLHWFLFQNRIFPLHSNLDKYFEVWTSTCPIPVFGVRPPVFSLDWFWTDKPILDCRQVSRLVGELWMFQYWECFDKSAQSKRDLGQQVYILILLSYCIFTWLTDSKKWLYSSSTARCSSSSNKASFLCRRESWTALTPCGIHTIQFNVKFPNGLFSIISCSTCWWHFSSVTA